MGSPWRARAARRSGGRPHARDQRADGLPARLRRRFRRGDRLRRDRPRRPERGHHAGLASATAASPRRSARCSSSSSKDWLEHLRGIGLERDTDHSCSKRRAPLRPIHVSARASTRPRHDHRSATAGTSSGMRRMVSLLPAWLLARGGPVRLPRRRSRLRADGRARACRAGRCVPARGAGRTVLPDRVSTRSRPRRARRRHDQQQQHTPRSRASRWNPLHFSVAADLSARTATTRSSRRSAGTASWCGRLPTASGAGARLSSVRAALVDVLAKSPPFVPRSANLASASIHRFSRASPPSTAP